MAFRRRISIRSIMIIVFFIAVCLGLGIPAVEVYRTKEYHGHTGIDTRGTPTLAGWAGIQPPFWPRYLKRLAGRPWKRQPDCGLVTGFIADRCELRHPEMVLRIGGRSAYPFDSDQEERFEAILTERANEKTSP